MTTQPAPARPIPAAARALARRAARTAVIRLGHPLTTLAVRRHVTADQAARAAARVRAERPADPPAPAKRTPSPVTREHVHEVPLPRLPTYQASCRCTTWDLPLGMPPGRCARCRTTPGRW